MRISDWSSDVCSSDLAERAEQPHEQRRRGGPVDVVIAENRHRFAGLDRIGEPRGGRVHITAQRGRSEERRGGQKGVSTCRSRWSPYHLKNKTKAQRTNIYSNKIQRDTKITTRT